MPEALNESKNIQCSVCCSTDHEPFISTAPMMHPADDEQRFYFKKCGNCSSVFLANPVAESELDKYYTGSYLPYRGAKAWGKYAAFVERSQKQVDAKRLGMVKKQLKDAKERFSLLDVGCGNPSFLQLVQQKLNAQCKGIDFSDEGWREGNYDSLDLDQVSLDEFEPEQGYDIITLWHYLEHDYHLQSTIEKLHQCLKPGGKLIIEVPDYQSMSAKRQGEFWQGWHTPRHISLFSREGFEALFPEKKWAINQHHRYGTLDAFTLWWMGKREAEGIDWSTSMEKEFWRLVRLKVLSFPVFLFEKFFPMGIQLIVIEKQEKHD